MQHDIESANDKNESDQPVSGGFLKFYGLYWNREYIFQAHSVLPGMPQRWTGRGTRGIDRDILWMNFWGQKGVYVLYDRDLSPVYTGQAGLRKASSKDNGGRSLGERLCDHLNGKYRNGWHYFSWFGFLASRNEEKLKGKIKNLSDEEGLNLRRDPDWYFPDTEIDKERSLTLMLDSFEAVLIEAFVPRFNSRGGNLRGSTYVDQFESKPAFIRDGE